MRSRLLLGGTSWISLARGVGARLLLEKVAEQTWGSRTFLGLRCDLRSLPPRRPAKIEIAMEPHDCPSFGGFADELRRAKGPDCLQVLLLRRLCDAGAHTLHVATDQGGLPAYCQWLVRAGDQQVVEALSPGRHPKLGPNEVLLEGAYTFTRFRGLGLMADGMWQLLRRARDGGAEAAITYVVVDNVPALRGCAHVGFLPDHVRLNRRRFGKTRSVIRPVNEETLDAWAAATRAREPRAGGPERPS